MIVLLALLMHTPSLSAGVFYKAHKTIRLKDLNPTADGTVPMSVTGMNNSNRLVGYFPSADGNKPHAFVWDDATQTLTDLNTLLNADSSMATCVNANGQVAGIFWALDGSYTQTGFIWQTDGTFTTFVPATGGIISTVTAINDYGWVVGSYVGSDHLQTRGFLFDGSTINDLGDLGDPANSYVWAQALNNNGQVVGTLYSTVAGTRPQAFVSQAGSMAALDQTGTYSGSSAVAINQYGGIVAWYGDGQPFTLVGSFLWTTDWMGGGTLTDLGDLGGGGTSVFSLNTYGQATGTSLDASGHLNLFTWQNWTGMTATVDLAVLGSTAGFQQTSVNAAGATAGFVTSPDGSCYPVICQSNTLSNVSLSLPVASQFIASSVLGSQVIVNDNGCVACAGTTSQGVKGVFLLVSDADTDNDGLPDAWERQYFGHLGVDLSADPDGDGLTNLQEYQQSTDPTDYYNGQAPVLTILSGNNQSAAQMTFLPVPLGVRVTDQSGNVCANAPVVFGSFAGAKLTPNADGSGLAAAATVCTDADGVATVYCQLQKPSNNNIAILASASFGHATFAETCTDPATPPGAIFAGGYSTYAIQTDGSLWSWGANDSGQLADSTANGRDYALPVPASGTDTQSGAAGASHVVVLKRDGTVWTAGKNDIGQLGDNTGALSRNLLGAVPGLTGVQAVAAGDNHALALGSDGTVYAWGDNSAGQLAINPVVANHRAAPTSVAGLPPMLAVAAGSSTSLALDGAGNVWMWGGQPVGENQLQYHPPQKVLGLGSAIVQICAGYAFNYAIMSDGTLWAWNCDPSSTAFQVSTPVGIAALSTFDGQVAALGIDGNVYVGYDPLYELSLVPGPSAAVAVTIGWSHTVMADGNGVLWAFGGNNQGQTGTAVHEYDGSFARVAYFKFGTLDQAVDVDGDGLSDYEEVTLYHTDPTLTDTDGDTLSDYDEVFVYHTDPTKKDTDGDGIPDNWELANGLNPNDPSDANGDPDNDGLTNLQEYHAGTDPQKWSTADDGVPDGWKVKHGLDPLADARLFDTDGDGLTDAQEYQYGTDPRKWSTAGDGIPDGWKVASHLAPLRNISQEDPDGDGLTNLQEYQVGTDPNNKYSRGGSVPDGQLADVVAYLAAWPSLPDVQYAVIDLGVLDPMYNQGYGIALNNVGQAVFYGVDSNGSPANYLWTAGVRELIPTATNEDGFSPQGVAYGGATITGLNDQGVIIGTSSGRSPTGVSPWTGAPVNLNCSRAFQWQSHQSNLSILTRVDWANIGISSYYQDNSGSAAGWDPTNVFVEWAENYQAQCINNNNSIYGGSVENGEEPLERAYGVVFPHKVRFGAQWQQNVPSILGTGQFVETWQLVAWSVPFLGNYPVGDPYDQWIPQGDGYVRQSNEVPRPGGYLSFLDVNDNERAVTVSHAIGAQYEYDAQNGVNNIVPIDVPPNYGFAQYGLFTELPDGTPEFINEKNLILGSDNGLPFLWLADASRGTPIHSELSAANDYDHKPVAFNSTMQMLVGDRRIYRNSHLYELAKLMPSSAAWANLQTAAFNEDGSILASANPTVNGVAKQEQHAILLVPYHVDLSVVGYSDDRTQLTVKATVTLPKWDALNKVLNWENVPNGTVINWSLGTGSTGATLPASTGTTTNGSATIAISTQAVVDFALQASPASLSMYGATTQPITGDAALHFDTVRVSSSFGPGSVLPTDEVAGASHRKIALNGRPMTDSKPQAQLEADQEPEESYIDALTLTLRHATTDIYVPINSSELSLSVRRNSESDTWNLRRGLRVDERPDRPFGAGWSTNLTPNIHFVYQTPGGIVSLFQEADYAYVTDEEGSSYRFLIVYPPGGGQEFFPLPAANHEQATFLAHLEALGDGSYVFTKKYGTKLNFALAPAMDQVVLGDRVAMASSGAGTETHRYARATSLSDRSGDQIDFTFTTNDSIVPDLIANHQNPAQAITIEKVRKEISDVIVPGTVPSTGFMYLITGIKDPNGGHYTFNYQQVSGPTNYYQLIGVDGPADRSGNTSIAQYAYDVVEEPDSNPDLKSPTPWYHCDLGQVTDARQKTYAFTYALDQSRQIYSTTFGYYPQNGLPRNVSRVTLPDGIGQSHFHNYSYVALQNHPGADPTFYGHRASFVVDAMDNGRLYTFADNQVITLNDVKAYLKPTEIPNAFRLPHMVVFSSMQVTHFKGANVTFDDNPTSFSYAPGAGTANMGKETFVFDPSAGMALKSVTDFSNNTTSFAHTDPWSVSTLHPWYSGYYPVGTYDDPTSQTDARGHSKTFQYQTDWRLMSKIVDEENRAAIYTFDNLGRRVEEDISDPSGSVVQRTLFRYENGQFPSFQTRKTIARVGTANDQAAGSWCGDLVTTYISDAFGRPGQQIVDPDGLGLSTLFTYDLNNVSGTPSTS